MDCILFERSDKTHLKKYYNESQERAIMHRDGNMLLLAGPGSGKTFVITQRIKALIDSGINPGHILVITFTKFAAIQMRERYSALCAGEINGVTFGTFHSIFYNILKTHRLYRSVLPITENEKIKYIKRAVSIAGMEKIIQDNDELGAALSLVSACKNNGNDPKNFSQDRYLPDEFDRLFDAYNDLLKEFDRIDFDDMINLCLKLLTEDEELRNRWQSKFKYILIDEFQDISGNQYELIKLLAYPENNIFAVGDDDQSIYSFRGANVSLMKQFLADYPKTVKENLSVNYRSTDKIVDASYKVISENKERFEKSVKAQRKGMEEVEILQCSSEINEKESVTNLLKQLICDGHNINDIAILFRTNIQASEYAKHLRLVGFDVDYQSVNKPFSSEYIKDVLTYLRIAYGDNSRGSFLRIINKPLRFIKRDALAKNDKIYMRDILEFYKDDENMTYTIRQLYEHLERISKMKPFLGIHYIRNAIMYDRYVKEKENRKKYEEYIIEINALTELVKKCRDMNEVDDILSQCEHTAVENASKFGIKIMTFHASKGLEFETVILPDINNGNVPAHSVKTEKMMEEERRIFYVAMTRAKERLYITCRTDAGKKPSIFLSPLIGKNDTRLV